MGYLRLKAAALRRVKERNARGLMAVANTIAGRAKTLTPVNTGVLRASIQTALAPDGKEAYVGVARTAPHAPFIELGFRPHFVPFSTAPGLAVWARRVGVKAVGGGLFVGGPRSRLQSGTPGATLGGYSPYLPQGKVGKPFLRPAADGVVKSGEAIRVFAAAWRR